MIYYFPGSYSCFATSFNPTDLSGCKLWFKADSLALSNNDRVATWTNLADANNNASQSNSSYQPQYKSTDGPNSKPALYFTAARPDFIQTASGAAIDDAHIFIVYKSTTTRTDHERLLDKKYDTGLWMGRSATTANKFGGGFSQTGSPWGLFSTDFTDGTYWLIQSQRSGTTQNIWRNDGLSNASQTVTTAATDTTVYTIGANYGGGNMFTGNICEIIVYDSALSVVNQMLVEEYLRAKYNLYTRRASGTQTPTRYWRLRVPKVKGAERLCAITELTLSWDRQYRTNAKTGNASGSGTIGGLQVTLSASEELSSNYYAYKAFNNSTSTDDCWATTFTAYTATTPGVETQEQWIKIDFGAGVTKSIDGFKMFTHYYGTGTYAPYDFKWQQSSDGTNWSDVSGASWTGQSLNSNTLYTYMW